ncbi:MAG: hypothetical protein CMJ78_13690 [Planctomycetaceae bacterium]|nr:hypothetical protein [Planctomycetaceae bacterium]
MLNVASAVHRALRWAVAAPQTFASLPLSSLPPSSKFGLALDDRILPRKSGKSITLRELQGIHNWGNVAGAWLWQVTRRPNGQKCS